MLAAFGAVSAGRRGLGMPGSAETLPGEYVSPAAGFAAGQPLDTAPGCATLASFLEDAAGDNDRYVGASDDELQGVVCGWDRVEANASARKHAAVAELIRRRPAPGAAIVGPEQMPEDWHEFTGRELGAVLGVSAGDAEEILGLAHALEVRQPAIRRAVMEVNPEQARKRREHMAKRTRVERWAEDSGNAGLAGRELPPAEVLAADQWVTAWAKELRKAGLAGTMDQLGARAFMDLLLGTDSRPPSSRPDGTLRPGESGPDEPQTPAPAGPVSGVIPPAFAGRINLTIPATTVLDQADRPGEMSGIGPIDPGPGANTQDRYQIRASTDPGYLTHQRTGPLSRRVGTWCASRPLTRGASNWLIDDRQIRAARLLSCLL